MAMKKPEFDQAVRRHLHPSMALAGLKPLRACVYGVRQPKGDWLMIHVQSNGFPWVVEFGADVTLTVVRASEPEVGRGVRARLGAFLRPGTRKFLQLKRTEVLSRHRPPAPHDGSSFSELLQAGIEARFDLSAPLPRDVWLPFWAPDELEMWLRWLATDAVGPIVEEARRAWVLHELSLPVTPVV